MALKPLEADVEVISKLGTNPGVDNGLSEEQLKAKFDYGPKTIKDYINNYLIPELSKTVDTGALLKDILDTTLSKSDKAANAKATGESILSLRSLYAKTVQGGDYILETDGRFASVVVGESTVRVMGGEGVAMGNLFSLNVGSYQDIKLEANDYGLRRSDLVVVRCARASDNSLSFSLVGLTGEKTSGEPADPAYQQGDINTAGSVRDVPLWRAVFNGPTIERLDFIAVRQTQTATLTASGWSESAPYTQTISVAGVVAEKPPHVAPVYSGNTDADIALKEACAAVTYATPGAGKITFVCLEDKPGVDIPIQVEVRR